MAIENSPYIAGLNIAIPANTSPRAEGAAQIRGSKTALKNSFPNVDGAVTATAARMNEVFDNESQVPLGLIAMWYGSTFPDGWVECNGEIANGFETPDLRGLFIRGSNESTAVGTTGGNDSPLLSETLTVSGHALAIDQLPPHDHEYVDRYYAESEGKLTDEGASNIMVNDSPNLVGSGDTDKDADALLFVEAVTEQAGTGNTHTHDVTDSATSPFDNRPAFFTLSYICYVGIE